jgi:hypothetical protein
MLTTISSMLLLLQAYEDLIVGDDVSNLDHLWKAIMETKITFMFGAFTLLCAWSLTSLLLFHGMIISAAQTTNERVRGVYRAGSVDNAADKGCYSNWCTAFCEPWAVSRLPRDMSDSVQCHYEGNETFWDSEAHSGAEPPLSPLEAAEARSGLTENKSAGRRRIDQRP